MDNDRTKNAGDPNKGAIKQGAGNVAGDDRNRQSGNADKLRNKAENDAGGTRNSPRDDRNDVHNR